MKEYVIFKTSGDNWFAREYDTETGFTVTFSNKTNTSVDVTIAITHAGDVTADTIAVTSSSENISITW